MPSVNATESLTLADNESRARMQINTCITGMALLLPGDAVLEKLPVFEQRCNLLAERSARLVTFSDPHDCHRLDLEQHRHVLA